MINERLQNGVYAPTNDTTLDIDALTKFICFLKRNFDKYEHYDRICPVNNQPARLL